MSVKPSSFFQQSDLGLVWKWLRRGVPLAVSFICVFWILRQVSHVGLPAIQAAFSQIGWQQWLAAVAATGVSFWALGAYDAVWHRALRTGVSPHRAHRTGMAAIAVSQTLGFGAVTGMLVRWIALPQVSALTTTKLTLCVTTSFMAVWAAYAAVAYLALGLPLNPALVLGAVALLGLAAHHFSARLAPLWQRATDAGLWRMAGFAALDLFAAGTALYALMPEIAGLAWGAVLAAYVLALGVGLVSNAPAGLGAFEASLCAVLMISPDAALLAAVLAFRLVYYVVPALIAVVSLSLMRARAQGAEPFTQFEHTPPYWDLLHQGGEALATRDGAWLTRHLPFATVAIGDPLLHSCSANSLRTLRRHVRPRSTCIYKCDAETAVAARRLGWFVTRIAADAQIDPRQWTDTGPALRQLRRKLAQARKAGVTITATPYATEAPDMARIARDWARSNGDEMGFSMGRWDAAYVQNQRIYQIRVGGDLRGFVTFQTRSAGWALDLIRFTGDLPSGAIHLAITAAIEEARAAAVPMLSLGAVPAGTHPFASVFAQHRAGLMQFKSSFAPRWQPQYHAAPTRIEAVITALMLLIAVQNIQHRLMMIMRKRMRRSARSPLQRSATCDRIAAE